MSAASTPELVLRRVARRQYAAALMRRTAGATLAWSGAFLLLLLVIRLTGLVADVLQPWLAATLPALGLLTALATTRRRTARQAAHAVDERLGTDDLFLTHSLLERSPGAYAPLVSERAVARASAVRPGAVVPLRVGRPEASALAAVGLLALLAAVLPQWDPFGREELRRERQVRRERLEQSRREAGERAKVLKQAIERERAATEVQAELEKLQKDLRRMRPKERQKNLERLQARQQRLGKMWKKLKEKRLQDAFSRRPAGQRFGAEGQKMRQWRRELQRGETSGLQRELREMQELAERAAQSEDPAERQRLRRELERRMKAAQNFMASELNSKSMSRTMKQAKEQLSAAGVKGLSQEAMQALQESLELSQMEMEQLQQQLQNMQSVEEALKTIQQAKRLNQQGGLDGEQCQDCDAIGEYAKLYEELMQQAAKAGGGKGQGQGKGDGSGGGMGGQGTGEGNIAPTDDSLVTEHTPEKAPSPLSPGKSLLQWKTQGLAAPGEAREAYLEEVKKVKQGVSEAIVTEEVPPGYHDAIRQYFDDLEPQAGGAAPASESEGDD